MARIKELVHKYPNISFIVLAYALNWILLAAYYFGALKFIPFTLFTVILVWGPNFVAAFLTGLMHGWKGVKEHFGQFLKWRTNILWWLAALLVLPALGLLSVLINHRIAGIPLQIDWGLVGVSSLFVAFLLHMILGPTGEEAGWRGFMLPRLQVKIGALSSNLIIGLLWSLWHIPIWFLLPVWRITETNFFLFTFLMLSISPIIAWVFNNSRGSLLLVALTLGVFNFVNESFGKLGLILNGAKFLLTFCILCSIVSIIIYLIFGTRRLSRKPDSEIPVILES